jgi:hypothetical protein
MKYSPRRHRTYYLVYKAIEKGIIQSPKKINCIDCGKQADEYDHPRGWDEEHALDIEAVCHSCHLEREVKRRGIGLSWIWKKPRIEMNSEELQKVREYDKQVRIRRKQRERTRVLRDKKIIEKIKNYNV